MPAPQGTRPPNAGKGRPRGAANTMTRSLRDMILGALDDAGGQAYLAEQAHQNPAAFLTLLGRVLPREPIDTPPAVITLDFGFERRQPPEPLPTPGPVPEIIDLEAATQFVPLLRSADNQK
jgi:hypothetical protein